jgi:N-acetylglutamate synthase/N-acetylornithine aminotransferase
MPQVKRVLIIGKQPDLVDFSDPAIPQGMNADKIRAGLEAALHKLRERGFEPDVALTTTDEVAAEEVATALKAREYDCVVVGAGLRIVPKMTRIFEAVINAVHEHAPRARLAFNIGPEDSAAAAERQLARGS